MCDFSFTVTCPLSLGASRRDKANSLIHSSSSSSSSTSWNVAGCVVRHRAQDIFKQALQSPRVELRVIFADVEPPPLPAHRPPSLFRPVSWRKPLPDLPSGDALVSCEPNTSTPCKDDELPPPQPTPSTVTKMPPSTVSKVAPFSAMKATHPVMTPSRSACTLTAARSESKSKFTAFSGTRTVGRKLHIQLVKGKFFLCWIFFMENFSKMIFIHFGDLHVWVTSA